MTFKHRFIGLGHYKRTGKDTFANAFIAALYQQDPSIRAIKRPFSWKLKQICHELYAWAGLREPEFYETPEGGKLREVVLPKIGKSPRQIWIDFGTDAVRDKVYEKTWLDYLLKSDHEADIIVVPDVRFENEFFTLREGGGLLLKVVRPGRGPGPNRPDRELLKVPPFEWDNIIGSSGEVSELTDWATRYAKWVAGRGPDPAMHVSARDKWEASQVEVIEPWFDPKSSE